MFGVLTGINNFIRKYANTPSPTSRMACRFFPMAISTTLFQMTETPMGMSTRPAASIWANVANSAKIARAGMKVMMQITRRMRSWRGSVGHSCVFLLVL